MNPFSEKTNPFAKVALSMRPMFEAFGNFARAQLGEFSPEVREAAREFIEPKGKLIRPTLVFAAGFGAENVEKLAKRAAIVELTHLSSLIHDDVIDGAEMRRGAPSANKKYGAKTAVLLGDSIFAHTMLIAFDEDRAVSKRVALSVRTLCDGEVSQTLSDSAKLVSRKKYFEIVYGKTAVLFELACFMGASAASDSPEWIGDAAKAGAELGTAYQIYDDVCDWFMTSKTAGKTLGTDLTSGKQTFPVILLLENRTAADARAFLDGMKASGAAAVAETMRAENVPQKCQTEFLSRVSRAEKLLAPHGRKAEKLLEFCAAMRTLKFGSDR